MTVSEYRDLIDVLCQSLRNVSACVGDAEHAQAYGYLHNWHQELLAAECKTAKQDDRDKAARICEKARQAYSRYMMAEYDNQKIEAAEQAIRNS